MWDIIGDSSQEPHDVGMAQIFCYSGENEAKGHSLQSVYVEYCQQEVSRRLNRWIPFLKSECIGDKSESKSGKKARSRPLSRLEANAYLIMGVCSYLHWPLERDSAHRKARLTGTLHTGPCLKCKRRAKEAEWTAIIKAAKHLSKAADAGHACARYNLGLLLEAGFENAHEVEAVSKWLNRKAAQIRSAKFSLADFNKSHKGAVPPPPDPATDALERMMVGCGEPADISRARELYADAAHQGLDCARCLLGLRNLYRVHTPSDKPYGPLGLLSACTGGTVAAAVAMFGLGLLHLFNRTPEMAGAEECRRRAYDFFQKAAQLGHCRSALRGVGVVSFKTLAVCSCACAQA